MKDTIIFAPGIRETEVLRSLALAGRDSFAMRIMDARELSERMLLSAGRIPKETLPSDEEAYLIASFLHEIPYFGSSSYTDAKALSNAFLTMRTLLRKRDDATLFEILDRGEFPDKNEALKAVYTRYKEELKKRGLSDKTGLFYEALENGSSFEGDFLILKEFPLKPLDEELLKKASNGVYQEISISDLVEEKEEGKLLYTRAYGAVNEAEDILSRIFRKDYPLDTCVIACADSRTYSQLFHDLSCRYDIPVTFLEGIAILNTGPGRLLKLLFEREEEGFNGIDWTFKLLSSPFINKKVLEEILGKEITRRDLKELSNKMGSLRIGFDKDHNDRVIAAHERTLSEDLEEAKKKDDRKAIREREREYQAFQWTREFSDILSQGIPHTLNRLCFINEEEVSSRYDHAALLKITDTLETALMYLPKEEVRKLIPLILAQNVGRRGMEEGKLHITTIKGALSSLRENLFVCGLSANVFPGSPKEDPLLLDSDLLEFHEDGAPLSFKRIQRKKEDFLALVYYGKKRGSNIFLSYSSYDLVNLKHLNPSSVLYELYSSLDPIASIDDFPKSFKTAGFFESHLSLTEKTLKDYLRNRKPVVGPIEEEKEEIISLQDSRWSPSALEVFFECPRRFYLERLLHLENEQPDDPYQVLPATDAGTLMHSLMEVIGEYPDITKEEFLRRSSIAFDRLLTGRPAIEDSAAEQYKEEFLEMLEYAYDQDPKRGALSAEEEFRFDYPNGVPLRGYPDRIEALENGRDIIVDFKSKRKVEHKTDDIDSCLQVVVYSWLASQKGMPISYAEYRYPRLRKKIRCDYSEEIKMKLDQKMDEFKAAFDHHDFPIGKKKESERCKYCTLGVLCGKDEEEGEGDD